jgi:hypothetical protein
MTIKSVISKDVDKDIKMIKNDSRNMFNYLYLLISLLPLFIFYSFGGLFITTIFDNYIFPYFSILINNNNLISLTLQCIFIAGLLGTISYIFNIIITYFVNIMDKYIGIFGAKERNINLSSFLTAMTILFSTTLSEKVLKLNDILSKSSNRVYLDYIRTNIKKI